MCIYICISLSLSIYIVIFISGKGGERIKPKRKALRGRSGTRSRSDHSASASEIPVPGLNELGEAQEADNTHVSRKAAPISQQADVAMGLLRSADGPVELPLATSKGTRLDGTSDWKLTEKQLSEDALRKIVDQMGLLLMSTTLQLKIVKSIAVFCYKIPANNAILA